LRPGASQWRKARFFHGRRPPARGRKTTFDAGGLKVRLRLERRRIGAALAERGDAVNRVYRTRFDEPAMRLAPADPSAPGLA